jgi:hypothetical protein
MRSKLVLLVLTAMSLVVPSIARADDSPSELARTEYARGNELARATRWGEALGAFEASLRVTPHALTLYNIGVCERVLGRGTRARESFRSALTRAAADPQELAPSLREEANGFVDEYERTLARVSVTLQPADAGLAVDGRPLREHRHGDRSVLEAGVEAPGIGRPPPSSTFELELDPGTHVFTVSRSGYRDVVVARDFPGGRGPALDLVLAHLPATLHVAATVPGALVHVGGVDVGIAPIDVSRPAGTYRIDVTRQGYARFVNDVTLAPGEEATLRAPLEPERIPITKRWWFWVGAGVLLATATTVTWAITRPTPEPVPYDGGSAGWVVTP